MKMELPDFPKILIKQDTSLPDEKEIQALDAMIWIMDPGPSSQAIQTLRDLAPRLAWPELARRMDRFGENEALLALGHPSGHRTIILRPRPDSSTFEQLELAGNAVKAVLAERPQTLGVIHLGRDQNGAEGMSEALIAALHAGAFQLPRIGKSSPKAQTPQTLTLFGATGAPDILRAEATASGNNLARWLTQLPANYLNPGQYRTLAEALAAREGWEAQFLDEAHLEQRGAGAFLSVTAGSPDQDAGILHLKYRPKGKHRDKPLALVGKGICFDTGGVSLKGANGMLGMQGDMQGSAVALGSLLALSRMDFPAPVDCWLALAENHVDARASKPSDVVTAVDGTTIEIINTDAEGRMVLADTLALASETGPHSILDFATLTGSCAVALGHRISGAMSNRPDWILPLIETGQASGERVWPLPYERDYDQDLKSQVADVLQCRPPVEADHLYAARFLGRFVANDTPWVHVDMSAGKRKGGLAHIPSEFTGFGVRFAVNWLERLHHEA